MTTTLATLTVAVRTAYTTLQEAEKETAGRRILADRTADAAATLADWDSDSEEDRAGMKYAHRIAAAAAEQLLEAAQYQAVKQVAYKTEVARYEAYTSIVKEAEKGAAAAATTERDYDNAAAQYPAAKF